MERARPRTDVCRLGSHFLEGEPCLAGEALQLAVEEQQFEFATSITLRAGGNALLKPLSALTPELQGVQAGKLVGQV